MEDDNNADFYLEGLIDLIIEDIFEQKGIAPLWEVLNCEEISFIKDRLREKGFRKLLYIWGKL